MCSGASLSVGFVPPSGRGRIRFSGRLKALARSERFHRLLVAEVTEQASFARFIGGFTAGGTKSPEAVVLRSSTAAQKGVPRDRAHMPWKVRVTHIYVESVPPPSDGGVGQSKFYFFGYEIFVVPIVPLKEKGACS